MTAQASNTGPLICRLILMPNDPLGQINSNNPHPCLSSLLARRSERGESCARTRLQMPGQGWAPKGPRARAALLCALCSVPRAGLPVLSLGSQAVLGTGPWAQGLAAPQGAVRTGRAYGQGRESTKAGTTRENPTLTS